jgi:hypothetical protein
LGVVYNAFRRRRVVAVASSEKENREGTKDAKNTMKNSFLFALFAPSR